MTVAPYNITVLDQSPTFLYSPYRDGNLTDSWKVFYSNSPDASYDPTHNNSNLASGTSTHSTTMVGASVEIDFMGTAVSLAGSGTAGAYSTSLDNGQAIIGAPSDGNLVSHSGLDYGTHTLVLNVIQNQQLNLTSALLTVGVGDPGYVFIFSEFVVLIFLSSTITNKKINAVDVASDGSSSMDPFFSTSGTGPFNTDHDVSGYSRLDTNGAGGIISFKTNDA